MNLENILSKLGVGRKETVFLSVTPGVGLELVQLNVATKQIKNYAYRPLSYNESLREISDLEAFKQAVSELFSELKISTKSDVILNIPMVLLSSRELPVLLADEAITEALVSEAEQSYIFKRYEPVVSWVDVSDNALNNNENRKLYYSAIQKNVIDDLKTALHDLGMTLVDIQTSLMSVLRALIFSGFVEEHTKDGVSWNLMLVSQNGYSITSMVGKNINDYYEEPLAIKSFDGEEIYNAINASAQIALMSYPANYLVIVSETDLVSAELLAARLNFDGAISYYENNDFKKENLIDVDYQVLEEKAHKISLEAIGNAVSGYVALPLEFTFMSGTVGTSIEDPDRPIHVVLGGWEFDISQNGARNFSLILSGFIIVPFLLLLITLPIVTRSKQAKLDELETKVQQIESTISELRVEQNRYRDFDINSEMKSVVADNRLKLMAYIALGESVPKKLWLTYFVAKDNGKFDIKGKASNVQDVYIFYRNLKDSLINTQIRLHKLEMEGDSVDDAVLNDINQNSVYNFEITNMLENELGSANSGSQEQPKDNAQNNAQNNNQSNNNANNNSSNDDDEFGINNLNNNNNSKLSKPLLNFGRK